MKQKFYTEPTTYRYYALILYEDMPYCYIGKTTGGRLSAIYHRHRRGEIAATRDDFTDKDFDLYFLEELTLTPAQAYKRELAWMYVFEEQGYLMLNHARSLQQTEYPLPETAAYIAELQSESLHDILICSHAEYPTEFDQKTAPRPQPQAKYSPQKDPKDSTLSIRLSYDDKDSFLTFCADTGLTQANAFRLLLDRAADANADRHLQEMLDAKDAKIQELQKSLEELRQKKDSAESKTTTTPEDERIFLQKGIRQYLQLICPSRSDTQPLSANTYRWFKSAYPTLPVEAPAEEGYAIIVLEALYWGKSRYALFIIGRTTDGQWIRLRHYPRKNYTGPSPLNSTYAYRGARWFVGYRPAKDGAMELAFAFPLPTQQPNTVTTGEKAHPSLDDIIQKAKQQ